MSLCVFQGQLNPEHGSAVSQPGWEIRGRSQVISVLHTRRERLCKTVFHIWSSNSWWKHKTCPRSGDHVSTAGTASAVQICFSQQTGQTYTWPLPLWYFACCMNEDCIPLEIFYSLILSVIKNIIMLSKMVFNSVVVSLTFMWIKKSIIKKL